MSYLSILLVLALVAGQLVKIPSSSTGGVTVLDLAISLVTFSSLISLKFKLKKPSLSFISAFIFIGIATLSLILTPLHLNLGEYLVSFLYTLRFTLYVLFGWTIYSGALPKLQKQIPLVFIYSGLALSVLGFIQLVFLPDLSALSVAGWDPHYLRVVSTLFDPNFLGSFLVLVFLTTNKKIFQATLYLAILLTFSRSAYLAFAVSFFTFSLLKKSPKQALIAVLLVIGLGIGYLGYQKVIAQPRGINRQQSAEYRVDAWQTGWKMFNHSPVLGAGFNTYRYALIEYKLIPTEFTQARGASANDSSLLFVLATTGIIGLLSYLFFLGTLLRRNLLLFAGLTGIIAQSFFINNLFYPWVLLWIVLVAVKGE